MKVFVAGATGVIGRQLVPRLVAAGHEVMAMTRSESKKAILEALGAVPVVADALDPEEVADAVGQAKPEVIVHQLTAIGAIDLRHFDRDFARPTGCGPRGPTTCSRPGRPWGCGGSSPRAPATLRVRPHRRAGQERAGPARPHAGPEMATTIAAISTWRKLCWVHDWTEGIVLRYGAFYGPGTSMAPGEEQFEMVRKRKFPVVGNGGGVWSFIHIADAAEATVAAVENGSRGVYNVVDDDPAPVAEWLPELAQNLGAKKPMHVPRFVGRMFTG